MRMEDLYKELQKLIVILHEDGDLTKIGADLLDGFSLNLKSDSLPTDDEINQVACDEMQQDWNDLKFQVVYKDGYECGAKWMRDNIRNKNIDQKS